ncbi:MAG: class I SAM-dependent methyltransferase [Pseudomonadota bacterium]|nr:class I SAM-dependent methyltransferase [Pseudomonadota bacterium]
MAIPDTLAARLIETVFNHGLSGHLAMLGRQEWIGVRRGASAQLLEDTLAKYLPGVREKDLANPDDSYSETFFQTLGFTTIDSIDYSGQEGASLLHDLSQPMPETFKAQFDVIYDGGTCEHIFDVPTAFANIDFALKPGGVLIGHSPCNNWINHGFFQFCPELVYSYWEATRGYEILDLRLQPLRPATANKTATTTDPKETGRRPFVLGDLPNAPTIMHYVVRKPLQPAPVKPTHQMGYLRKWDGEGTPPPTQRNASG